MRNTVQKALILQTVRSMTNHPTADEVYDAVGSVCPSISKGTVYRNLNLLAESGEILRVSIANAPDRYDFTTGEHAHCRCRVCGRVFDYALRRVPELDDSCNSGFSAENYYIIVNGICKECRENTRREDRRVAAAEK